MATVAMVMLLLMMGLILVMGLSDRLTEQNAGLALVRAAIEGQNDALSLQAQALQFTWDNRSVNSAKAWEECHSFSSPSGIACLQSLADGRYLLGVQLAPERVAPVIWRWVVRFKTHLAALPNGWLDLCPAQALRCQLL